MIGEIETTVRHEGEILGVFQGKLFKPMSEYAPLDMAADLQVMLNRAEVDHRIVVSANEQIRKNDPHSPQSAQLIFIQWVQYGKASELADHNRAFYDKLEKWKFGRE